MRIIFCVRPKSTQIQNLITLRKVHHNSMWSPIVSFDVLILTDRGTHMFSIELIKAFEGLSRFLLMPFLSVTCTHTHTRSNAQNDFTNIEMMKMMKMEISCWYECQLIKFVLYFWAIFILCMNLNANARERIHKMGGDDIFSAAIKIDISFWKSV